MARVLVAMDTGQEGAQVTAGQATVPMVIQALRRLLLMARVSAGLLLLLPGSAS